MFNFAFKLAVWSIVGLVVLGCFGLYKIRKETGTLEPEVVKDYLIAEIKNDLSAKEKAVLKGQAIKAKDKVYEEATEHNPEGDVLPDEIDDNVKAKIKEEIQ